MNRLHPSIFALAIGPYLRQMGVFIVVSIFANRRGDYTFTLALIGISLLLAVLSGLLKYITTSFGFSGDRFEYHSGWIWKQHKVIPLARIQAVLIEQNLVHRLFGSASIKIDTGVANKLEEVTIPAIALNEAQHLKEKLLHRSEVIPTETGAAFELPAAAPTILELSTYEVLMHGFANNRWLYVVATLFGLAEFVDDFGKQIASAVASFAKAPFGQQVVQGTLSVLALLIVGWLVSIVFSLTQYYQFTLRKHSKGLQIERGLFTKRQSIIALNRVGGVEIYSNVFMRMLGVSALNVHVLGAHGEEGGKTVVTPWVETHKLDQFMELVLPGVTTKPGGWNRYPPRRAIFHILRNLVAISLLVVVPSILIPKYVPNLSRDFLTALDYARYFFVAVFVIGLFRSILSLKIERARVTDLTFEDQRGWLNRKWHFLPLKRLQVTALHSSRMSRLFGLRSLAASTPALALSISDIDRSLAVHLFEKIREIRRQFRSRGV